VLDFSIQAYLLDVGKDERWTRVQRALDELIPWIEQVRLNQSSRSRAR